MLKKIALITALGVAVIALLCACNDGPDDDVGSGTAPGASSAEYKPVESTGMGFTSDTLVISGNWVIVSQN